MYLAAAAERINKFDLKNVEGRMQPALAPQGRGEFGRMQRMQRITRETAYAACMQRSVLENVGMGVVNTRIL